MFTFAHPPDHEVTLAKIFLAKLRLFESRPDLAAKGRYTITSGVDRDVVDLFFARVMGDEAEVVTADNAEQLRALCDELGFSGFDGEIRAVLGGDVMTKTIRVEIQERLDGHDVRLEDLDVRLEEFWEALGRLDEQVTEIASQLEVVLPSIDARLNELARAVREGFPERPRAVDGVGLNDMEGAVAEAKREAGSLREDVERLRSKLDEKASAADLEALSKEVARLKAVAGKVTAPAGTEFVYNDAKPLDGIIAHLTSECGGNVHEKGVVKVTASSCLGGKPENAVDLNSDSEFESTNARNTWICYDFQGKRVTPTSYSITSCGYGPGNCHLKSWVLEVSNDGSEGSWATVDSRKNNEDMKMDLTCNFAVSASSSGAFRFVRLRQTGKNHDGDDCLAICGLELFGTLYGE